MKMRKKLAVFVSTVALSGGVFATSVDREVLASECKHLGLSLVQLSKASTAEYCSVDVRYSGKIMEKSSSLIQANRVDIALDNLVLANRMLERVVFNHHDCPYLSSMIVPYGAKTDRLIHELDSLQHHSMEGIQYENKSQ